MSPEREPLILTIGKLGGYAVYMDGPDAIGQRVKVSGKVVCFDFCERSGPLIVTREGEPSKHQPTSDDSPFWPPFERWLAGYWKAKGGGDLDGYLKANDGTLTPRPLRYPGRSHPKNDAGEAI